MAPKRIRAHCIVELSDVVIGKIFAGLRRDNDQRTCILVGHLPQKSGNYSRVIHCPTFLQLVDLTDMAQSPEERHNFHYLLRQRWA